LGRIAVRPVGSTASNNREREGKTVAANIAGKGGLYTSGGPWAPSLGPLEPSGAERMQQKPLHPGKGRGGKEERELRLSEIVAVRLHYWGGYKQ